MKTTKTEEKTTIVVTSEEQEFLKELDRAFGEMLQDVDSPEIIHERIVDNFERLVHYGITEDPWIS